MKIIFFVITLTIVTIRLHGQDNALYYTERFSINSEHLKEGRNIQVYLPHNYFYTKENNYPVAYLIDGDYNLHYNVGLIEQLSLVSEKIPELIVVGIAAKGHSQYKKNCTPSHFKAMEGRTEIMMDFIDKELKQHINSTYRTSDYDIIIGHSLGGLLVADYMLKRPKSFDNFISIEPSIWWGNAQEVALADSLLKGKEDLETNFYISLADTKGMQVREFVGMLDKHLPMNEKWHYLKYDNENHGSVGLPTIKDALLDIFDGWAISRDQFYSFKSIDELTDHFKNYNKTFNSKFTLPTSALANFMYYYYRQDKQDDLSKMEAFMTTEHPSSLPDFYTKIASFEMKKEKYEIAQKHINKALAINPYYFLASREQAKIYFAKKRKDKATATITKAINIAKKLHARQWLINEMEFDLEGYLTE